MMNINQMRIFLEPYKILKLDAVHINPESAWVGHALFAYLCARELRPKCLVELGTHTGCSFFSFCEGLLDTGVPYGTRWYAVDTWQGDHQAGFYNDSIYQSVKEYTERHFSTFAVLKKMLFDKAAQDFGTESIDFLHIDGLHTYEAVKHDFELWFPKVKPGGIILFHDICEHKNDFGVWKFWDELKQQYSENFEFHHFHGLGILRKPGGEELKSDFIASLLRLPKDESAEEIRQFFANCSCNHPPLEERVIPVSRIIQINREISQLQQKNIELELRNQLFRNLKGSFPQTKQPFVSIIVPCYNNFTYTKDCLTSIAINSGNLNYEVILADDNSTDETKFADRQFSNLRIIKNESGTKGFLHNVKYAAQSAKGKYLLLLNNDTIVSSNWLRPLIEEMEKHNDIGVAGCTIHNPFFNSIDMGRVLLSTGDSFLLGAGIRLDQAKRPQVADVDFVQGSVFLIRKELWDKIGGFDPVFAPGYFEETDLCMRLKIQYGLRIICYTDSKIIHFESKTFSPTGKEALYQRNRRIFVERYGTYLKKREENAVAKFHRSPIESVFLDNYASQWGIRC